MVLINHYFVYFSPLLVRKGSLETSVCGFKDSGVSGKVYLVDLVRCD